MKQMKVSTNELKKSGSFFQTLMSGALSFGKFFSIIFIMIAFINGLALGVNLRCPTIVVVTPIIQSTCQYETPTVLTATIFNTNGGPNYATVSWWYNTNILDLNDTTNATLVYRYNKDLVNNDFNDTSLYMPQTNVPDWRFYFCTVTTHGINDNSCPAGSEFSSTLGVIYVDPIPTPFITANGPVTFCGPGSVSLTTTDPGPYLWSNGATTQSITVTTSGTYTVSVMDWLGCSGNSNAITVSFNNNITPVITGGTSFCNFGVLEVGYYQYYLWSDNTTADKLVVTSSGTYSVTVTDFNGCTGSASASVTVTPSPVQPASILGDPLVCATSPHVYSIAPVSGATDYTWTLPSGWTGNSNTTSISTIIGINSGDISVTANNGVCSSVPQVLTVGVSTYLPVQPGTITGTGAACTGTVQTYTIDPVVGATEYIWTLPGDWSGTSTTTSITATLGTSGNVSVQAGNPCGHSTKSSFFVNVTNYPLQPGLIAGLTNVCAGTTQTYVIDPVPGAISYIWTLPSGWVGNSSTTSITATIGDPGGNIMVKAVNGCYTGPSRVLYVAVMHIPYTPGNIFGSSLVCSGSSQTYTINPVLNATSYFWMLPNGWIGSSTSTSITVQVGAQSGNIGVLSMNDCGISNTTRTIAISVSNPPSQPSPIIGSNAVCAGSSQFYRISPVAGALSYTWTLPSGWTGTSTAINIIATVGTTSGSITVTANNNCGTSIIQTLPVTVNSIPLLPGNIIGSNSVCVGSTQTYSIDPVAGATSYVWTRPSGWSGTSSTNSITCVMGISSGNVTVKAVNACGSSPVQTLAVTVHNVVPVTISGIPGNFNFCSQVTPTNVDLTASAGYSSYYWLPDGQISNNITVYTANNYTVRATDAYGCTTTATKTITNNCALPTNMTTTNILGSSAKGNWMASQCAYNYSLRIAIDDGLNSWTVYTTPANNFTFTGLRAGTNYQWQIKTNCNTSGDVNSGWSAGQFFTTLAARTAEDFTTGVPFNVYPNPANSSVTLTFSTMEEGLYNIRLVDMFGRVVKSDFDNAGLGDNNYTMSLDGIAKGIYLVTLQKGDVISKVKLIVE